VKSENRLGMKKIGLVGGISWQSTLEYYRIINETAMARLGNGHSAKILIESLDFGEVEVLIKEQDFAGLTDLIVNSAKTLERAGAELLLICANTMHFVAPQVQQSISIPLVHILDATIERIREQGLSCVALLGTEFTMEQDFYKGKLIQQGINVLIPGKEDRHFVHQTIFTELFQRIIRPDTKSRFLTIIDSLSRQGAQGVILGCTELPLLLNQQDCSIPVFDTTEIHSKAAVDFAM